MLLHPSNGHVVLAVSAIAGLVLLSSYLVLELRRLMVERKHADHEREELAGRLIDAHERERSRLARELHDDFSQRLAILAFDLEKCAEITRQSSPEASAQMLELWTRTSEIGADLHSLSHQLHSSTLEILGLLPGISSLCSEFSEQQGVRINFTHRNVPRSVPSDVALCVFRIVQEGLRNVKKHSRSTNAEVRLDQVAGEIHVSIFDHGNGFDGQNGSLHTGFGIRNMEERLRLLKGRLRIQSQPSQGTRIDVWVPLPAATAAARAA